MLDFNYFLSNLVILFQLAYKQFINCYWDMPLTNVLNKIVDTFSFYNQLTLKQYGFELLSSTQKWIFSKTESGSLWLQRADCMLGSMPFYIRELEHLQILVSTEGFWNQSTADTEGQLRFWESQSLCEFLTACGV